MPHYLLLCRSITYAQRMSGALEQAGISARVLRPPVGLTDRGCAYGVRLRPGTLEAALTCLQAAGIKPLAVYHHTREGYREAAQ